MVACTSVFVLEALMMMGLRTGIYAISLLGGAIISCVIVWFGLYLPLNYPGFFFAVAILALGHGDHWKSWVLPTLVISANTIFYGWIVSRILRSEVAARGARADVSLSKLLKHPHYPH